MSHSGLSAEDFPLLLLPAGEYAALRRGLPGITKEAALAGSRVPEGGFAALFASAPVVTVTLSSTLEQVRGCRVRATCQFLSNPDPRMSVLSLQVGRLTLIQFS